MSEENEENRPLGGEEFRGKTVEAAIGAGLTALGVGRDQVEVEVVKAGSRGVLGIGAEDAVVRLTLLPISDAQEAESQPKPEGEPVSSAAAPAKPRDGAEEARRHEQGQKPPSEARERVEPSAAPASPKARGAAISDDKAAAATLLGSQILQGLIDRMNVRARVEVVPQSDAEVDDGEPVQVLNIVGDDLGVLIGRQNEVLSAMELITRLMVNQSIHARSDFIVDVNGYRAKRAESLRKLALRMADQVVETGRTAFLEPMSPAERRIIHIALRDHPGVTTQSIGEGDRRKVTIVPKRE
jgi:spoIIIJ-associated protein